MINRLTHQIKSKLDQLRLESYNRHIEELQPNDPGMWKTTKRILRKRDTISPITVDNQQIYYTDSEKCQIFAEHLNKVFSPKLTVNDHF